MDAEVFLDFANQVAKVKMYPYFDLAHAIVCCLSIKEDMASGMVIATFSVFYTSPCKICSCKAHFSYGHTCGHYYFRAIG